MDLYVFAVLGLSFLLLVTGWIKPDIVAVLVLLSLVFGGAVEPAQAFSGFSSFAVVTIAALMVIGDGLERTGVVQWVARKLEKVIRGSRSRLLLVNTGVPGLLSGFVNIVAAASFFIPVILRLCKKMRLAPSRVLLPMACAALIGANLTLIGASHNLVVHSFLEDVNGEGFGFFEFSAVGGILLLAAIGYFFIVGQRLLPGGDEAPDAEEIPVTVRLIEIYELEDRLFEIWVDESADDRGVTIAELDPGARDLELVAVVRAGDHLELAAGEQALAGGDMLLVQGRRDEAETLAGDHGFLTFMGPPEAQKRYPLSTAELAEAVVPPRSPAIGRTPRELGLVEQYGLKCIAFYRDDRAHRSGALDVRLEEGDSLLFYGPRDRMREFEPERELLVYFKPGVSDVTSAKKRKAPFAAAILAAVILVAAVDLLPIAVSALAGAALMVLVGIVDWHRLYSAVDWKTLVLIAGMYPLGIALDQSGAADRIGELLVGSLGDFGPLAVLAGISVLCMILTQPMHNAAVAIIMTPIAINAAQAMDTSIVGYCVAVVVSCSAAFLMPYGHPAPFLVQEPGDYSPADYLRFGAGLIVLTLAMLLFVVPLLWPL
ncbi:MAG: SLC13 family permease [Wenzhouxiangellaceae bacterium]|nr:SLC13 family permease [Wenzhouxiangellaceae bacterium]